IFQLRTGHIPLNKHLHCTARVGSLKCPNCHTRDKTVLHFLLECPASAYRNHRHRLKIKLKRKAGQISSLLSNEKCVKETLRFIHGTKRFSTTHGDL
ncbi:hypothetical protein PAXINDRAFT_26620, partial [Paxillus involutus ATCC 200175]